jgi:hypothetical protein
MDNRNPYEVAEDMRQARGEYESDQGDDDRLQTALAQAFAQQSYPVGPKLLDAQAQERARKNA